MAAEYGSILALQDATRANVPEAALYNLKLKESASALYARLLSTEIIIAAIPNSTSRFILREYYQRQNKWENIANSLGYSVKHMYRLRVKALLSAYNALVAHDYIKAV